MLDVIVLLLPDAWLLVAIYWLSNSTSSFKRTISIFISEFLLFLEV